MRHSLLSLCLLFACFYLPSLPLSAQQPATWTYVFEGYYGSNFRIRDIEYPEFDRYVLAFDEQVLSLADHEGTPYNSLQYLHPSIGNFSFIKNSMNGGFVVGGSSPASAADSVFLLAVDDNLMPLWMRTYPGAELRSLVNTPGGGFLMAVQGNQDFQVIKTGVVGNVEWHLEADIGATMDCKDAVRLDNGTFVVLGAGYHATPSQGWTYLLHLDRGGVPIRCVGWQMWDKLSGIAIAKGLSGGFQLTGQLDSAATQRGFIIDADSAINLNWARVFASDSSESGLDVANNGGKIWAIAAGDPANSSLTNANIYQFDEQGNHALTRQLARPGNNSPTRLRVLNTTLMVMADSDMGGTQANGSFLSKFEPVFTSCVGVSRPSTVHPFMPMVNTFPVTTTQGPAEQVSYFPTLQVVPLSYMIDCRLASTTPETEVTVEIWPVPAHSQTHVRLPAQAAYTQLRLLNLQGQEIFRQSTVTTPGVLHTWTLPLPATSQILFLEIVSGDFRTVKKILVE